MPKLANAGTVWGPATNTLANLGFSVDLVDDEDADQIFYVARRDGWELSAGDPVSLLGLAAVLLFRGEAWSLAEGERDWYAELIADF